MSFATRVHAVVSLENQSALAECYIQLSLSLFLNNSAVCFIIDMVHHADMLCKKSRILAKSSVPLATFGGSIMGLINWKIPTYSIATTDNGYDPVALEWCCIQIELLIQIRIVIALSIVNLGAIVKFPHSNQSKNLIFGCVSTSPGYYDALLYCT